MIEPHVDNEVLQSQ